MLCLILLCALRDVVFAINLHDQQSSLGFKGKILNGHEAASNELPYQVGIVCTRPQSTKLCGGSIISEDFVLTAGHCTIGYNFMYIQFRKSIFLCIVWKRLKCT